MIVDETEGRQRMNITELEVDDILMRNAGRAIGCSDSVVCAAEQVDIPVDDITWEDALLAVKDNKAK